MNHVCTGSTHENFHINLFANQISQVHAQVWSLIFLTSQDQATSISLVNTRGNDVQLSYIT